MSNSRKQNDESSLSEYLDECTDKLERFSKNLSAMETGKAAIETISAIYRDIHTIKGNAQFFGHSQIGVLAHAMESCLDPIRSGSIQLNSQITDCLFKGSDIISSLLDGIRQEKCEPDLNRQVSEIVHRLIDLTSSQMEEPENSLDSLTEIPSEASLNEDSHSPETKETEHPGFEIFDDKPVNLEKSSLKTVDAAKEVVVSITDPKEQSSLKNQTNSIAFETLSHHLPEDVQSESIRVQVSLLDNLMNLVGELVLIRNQFLQHAKINDTDSDFANMSQRLNILTAELQNEVMKTRMQPIGNVFSKFNRVTREVGRELGKKIELSIFGSETELDKTIIEAVKDPLTHIVRNSVDHGIELPSERVKLGKSEFGRLIIRAHHESGQVIIEIVDDGRGLDRETIGSNAVKKGLVSLEALSKMTDREVHFLIFNPGFSTASSVSNLSGRGVGMDVVKTNIERIGGMVDLLSTPGSGTTIKLKIPLTLAIVPALIVRAIGQRFAIPQVKLVELVRIDQNDRANEKIETLQGSPVLRLRGKILPLLCLSTVLSKPLPKKSLHLVTNQEADSLNIVILNADSFQFGLIVDSVEDTADIVVKSLSPFLKELSHYSGATIMGDGSVALTLDVLGISSGVRPNFDLEQSKIVGLNLVSEKKKHHQLDFAEFLLIDVGAPGSYVIPLTVVSRLEEFSADEFELSGEQKVIRYRDSLLPVFSLPEFLQLPFTEQHLDQGKVPVVVVRRGDNLFGIEVYQIQDVVSMSSKIDQTVRDRPGILGTLVSNDAVLVVVDIFGMIDAVKSQLAADSGSNLDSASSYDDNDDKQLSFKRSKYRVLVVEDSSFFRGYIRQVLEDAGYKVQTACDGLDGWNTLESHSYKHFSLVLSDIEMPSMDGIELASKISSDKRFEKLLLVAITTRFSGSDRERGLEAGFNRYLEKLNAEKLILELDELLSVRTSKSETGKELKLANSY